MSARDAAIRRKILAWADHFDVPVTVRQVERLVLAMRLLGPDLPYTPLVKPGATPDDARRIAARLEATWPTSN
jgi:hypothetical protein